MGPGRLSLPSTCHQLATPQSPRFVVPTLTNPETLPRHLLCLWCRCSQTPADVYFLADNSGTMTEYIAQIQSGANLILSSLAGNVSSLWTGGGAYRDQGTSYPPSLPSNSPQRYTLYRNWANVANGTAGATTAISSWSAVGLNVDYREAQLFALYKVRCLLAPLHRYSLSAAGVWPMSGASTLANPATNLTCVIHSQTPWRPPFRLAGGY